MIDEDPITNSHSYTLPTPPLYFTTTPYLTSTTSHVPPLPSSHIPPYTLLPLHTSHPPPHMYLPSPPPIFHPIPYYHSIPHIHHLTCTLPPLHPYSTLYLTTTPYLTFTTSHVPFLPSTLTESSTDQLPLPVCPAHWTGQSRRLSVARDNTLLCHWRNNHVEEWRDSRHWVCPCGVCTYIMYARCNTHLVCHQFLCMLERYDTSAYHIWVGLSVYIVSRKLPSPCNEKLLTLYNIVV